MQQLRSLPFSRAGRVFSLIFALALVLSLFCGQALAAETEDSSDSTLEIMLAVEEQNAPGYSDYVFYAINGQRYFLLLDGELLVVSDTQEALTGLVSSVTAQYCTENTVSCTLADSDQLRLCFGYYPSNASRDLESAAETLMEKLQVVTVERTVRTETTPYLSVVQEDEDRYSDEEPIVSEGSDGITQITEETTCLNGEPQSTETVHTEVLQEMIAQVTTVGTKERPEYIWPASGRISSKFGRRNIAIGSKNHKGIDIAVSYGSDIVAAKAGTVIYAQYNSGGYGYLVKIEHEDGDVTYYAHNSSLTVSVGDVVEQGDVIAKAGSTGRSTGTHCHFEIRINGTPVDPLDYLE